MVRETASGFFQVERKRGDVSLPVGGRNTQLDLKQLRLRGDFAGQALRIDAALDTARLGNVSAQGQLGLMPSGPRRTRRTRSRTSRHGTPCTIMGVNHPEGPLPASAPFS